MSCFDPPSPLCLRFPPPLADGTFEHTGILYLNSRGIDYDGGEFEFFDDHLPSASSSLVEPVQGRLLLFTSGRENRHRVRRVRAPNVQRARTHGVRYAWVLAATCSADAAVPLLHPALRAIVGADAAEP